MSETVPNQGLFRVYAALWLVGLSLAAMVAHQLVSPSRSTAVTYLAIGAGLWLLNMVLVARYRGAAQTRREGHAVAHAILTTALALAWPLVLAGLLVFLAAAVVNGLRRGRQAT